MHIILFTVQYKIIGVTSVKITRTDQFYERNIFYYTRIITRL